MHACHYNLDQPLSMMDEKLLSCEIHLLNLLPLGLAYLSVQQ